MRKMSLMAAATASLLIAPFAMAQDVGQQAPLPTEEPDTLPTEEDGLKDAPLPAPQEQDHDHETADEQAADEEASES